MYKLPESTTSQCDIEQSFDLGFEDFTTYEAWQRYKTERSVHEDYIKMLEEREKKNKRYNLRVWVLGVLFTVAWALFTAILGK